MFCNCLILSDFCIFWRVNILQKVFENFSHFSSFPILAQIFASFDCLRSFWCNLSWKFSVIDLNSGLKFSGKFISLYLGPFSCKMQVLEKDGACFFSAGFCIFQQVTCRGVVIFHIFKLKKQLFPYEEKVGLSEKELVKYHETANFWVCRERYQWK